MGIPLWRRGRAAIEGAIVRLTLRIPPIRDGLARKRAAPVEGHVFDRELAAALRLDDIVGESDLRGCTPPQARVRMAASILAAESAPPRGVRTRDRTIARRPARLYEPENLPTPSPGVFFFHGGGFVTGDLDTHDALCRRLAHFGRVRVVAFDYRLAPEHPYPAAVEDALAGFRELARDAASYGIDAKRIALAGDSAGGNLSAVVARRTKDDDVRPALYVPIYPATDARSGHASHRTFAEGYILSATMVEWYYDQYTASDRSKRSEPDMSPLLADDLAGLPPAIVYVAGFDPLRDEGIAYAKRANARLVCFDTLPHGFALTTGLSAAALGATVQIAREIGEALSS